MRCASPPDWGCTGLAQLDVSRPVSKGCAGSARSSAWCGRTHRPPPRSCPAPQRCFFCLYSAPPACQNCSACRRRPCRERIRPAKVHLDFFDTVALAALAPPALDVKGKTALIISFHLGVLCAGEEVADMVKYACIGGGVAAGRPPNGRLVDVNHLVNLGKAGNFCAFPGDLCCHEGILPWPCKEFR